MDNQLAIFENKPIRSTEYNGEIYFSIVDIIGILADAAQPASYWNKIKKALTSESQLLPFWQKLKF
jgi:hypothetical protein